MFIGNINVYWLFFFNNLHCRCPNWQPPIMSIPQLLSASYRSREWLLAFPLCCSLLCMKMISKCYSTMTTIEWHTIIKIELKPTPFAHNHGKCKKKCSHPCLPQRSVGINVNAWLTYLMSWYRFGRDIRTLNMNELKNGIFR